MKKILLLLAVALFATLSQGQSWTRYNKGLGKCPAMGQSGPEGEWYSDNIRYEQLFTTGSDVYTWITYDTAKTTLTDGVTLHPFFNPVPCAGGIFKFFRIDSSWYKIAEVPPHSATDKGEIITYNNKAYYTSRGKVWLYTPANGTGWAEVSNAADSLTNTRIGTECLCYTNDTICGNAITFGKRSKAIFNDTLYVYMEAGEKSTCANQEAHYIAKFSLIGKTWSMEYIGPRPDQVWKKEAPATAGYGGTKPRTFVFADNVFGTYRHFYQYSNWGNTCFIPRFYWVKNPENGRWENISSGMSHVNFSNNSCSTPACHNCKNQPGSCSDTTEVITSGAKWMSGKLMYDPINKKLVVGNEQGMYVRTVTGWDHTAPQSYGAPVMFTRQKVFSLGYYARGPIKSSDFEGNIRQYGANEDLFYCKFNSNTSMASPDEGKSLFVIHKGMKDRNICAWPARYTSYIGIYGILSSDSIGNTSPKQTSNLNLVSGTYLGGSGGDNTPVGVVIGGNQNIHVAGNFAGAQALTTPGAVIGSITNTLFGASSTRRGKIITLNPTGDTLLRAVTLGDTITDIEYQHSGDKRIVVSGSFGVAVLDSNAQTVIWRKNLAAIDVDLGVSSDPDFGSTPYDVPYPYIDIDDNGSVVVAMGRRFNHFYRVANADGTWRDKKYTIYGGGIIQEYLNDVAISGDKVYFAGFNNGLLNEPGATSCEGVFNGLPVQSSWVKCHEFKSGGYAYKHKTFGYQGRDLTLDQADTRAYKISMGQNGKLYMLGEAAGGNSCFRWKGGAKDVIQLNECTNPANGLIETDLYTQPVNTSSAHIAYYCEIDTATGLVNKGQYIIPRRDDGVSATFRIKDGYIQADKNGDVYITGASAYKFPGRDLQTINGKKVGAYAGDLCVLTVSNDFRTRKFWGTFSDSLGSGYGSMIALGDKYTALVARNYSGKMMTGGLKKSYSTTFFCSCDVKCSADCKTFSDSAGLNNLPFNLRWNSSNPNEDAYLAVWKKDFLNQSPFQFCETEGGETPNSGCNQRIDFYADRQIVYVGDTVLLTPDIDLGGNFIPLIDSVFWKTAIDGNFYYHEPHLNGTVKAVYTQPGYKDVMMLGEFFSSGDTTRVFKQNFILVQEHVKNFDFSKNTNNILPGATVEFSFIRGNSTQPIDSIAWLPGHMGSIVARTDSSLGYASPVSVAYDSSGLKTVTMRVYYRSVMVQEVVKVDFINIIPHTVDFDFTADTTTARIEATVTFTPSAGNSTQPVDSIHWTFGENAVVKDSSGTGYLAPVSVSYTASGLKNVSMSLYSGGNLVQQIIKTQYINVLPHIVDFDFESDKDTAILLEPIRLSLVNGASTHPYDSIAWMPDSGGVLLGYVNPGPGYASPVTVNYESTGNKTVTMAVYFENTLLQEVIKTNKIHIRTDSIARDTVYEKPVFIIVPNPTVHTAELIQKAGPKAESGLEIIVYSVEGRKVFSEKGSIDRVNTTVKAYSNIMNPSIYIIQLRYLSTEQYIKWVIAK